MSKEGIYLKLHWFRKVSHGLNVKVQIHLEKWFLWSDGTGLE